MCRGRGGAPALIYTGMTDKPSNIMTPLEFDAAKWGRRPEPFTDAEARRIQAALPLFNPSATSHAHEETITMTSRDGRESFSFSKAAGDAGPGRYLMAHTLVGRSHGYRRFDTLSRMLLAVEKMAGR